MSELVNKDKKIKEGKRSNKGYWIFMGITIILYLVILIVNKTKGIEVATDFYHLALEIFPFLLIVFVLMVLINLFLKPALLIKYMGEGSGIIGWIISVVAGILSMGAIYMWFPMLQEIRDKGVKPGLLAVFLYNRGVKLNWLPVMIVYFGLKYVVIITFVMIFTSIIQGVIIDFFIKDKKQPIKTLS